MSDRGARLGWILGGLGSLLWLPAFSISLFMQGNWLALTAAAVFFTIGLGYLFVFAPWKRSNRPFWIIYLGFLIILFSSAITVFFIYNPEQLRSGIRLSGIIAFFPMFLPIFIIGKKTWNDLHPGSGS